MLIFGFKNTKEEEFFDGFFACACKRIRDLREKFQENRVLFMNHERPDCYEGSEPLKYASNKIKTSKVRFFSSSS